MSTNQVRVLLALAGALIVCALGMLSVSSLAPKIYAPFSIPVLFPAIFASMTQFSHLTISVIGSVPMVLVYLVWVMRGSREDVEISNASVLVITATALISVIYHAAYFQQGMATYGIAHVLAICAINLLALISLPIGYWHHYKHHSIYTYMFFYLIYFSWLSFSAFPWFAPSVSSPP
ncbi:hypothetical protein ACFO4O_10035 [Glaciecola siphonariae]|uniref:Uncharacterized protein n=1 Tax=Glaciecola siphonariae TaxID=521012 RepID=A0ABV9LWY1_9ALTE